MPRRRRSPWRLSHRAPRLTLALSSTSCTSAASTPTPAPTPSASAPTCFRPTPTCASPPEPSPRRFQKANNRPQPRRTHSALSFKSRCPSPPHLRPSARAATVSCGSRTFSFSPSRASRRWSCSPRRADTSLAVCVRASAPSALSLVQTIFGIALVTAGAARSTRPSSASPTAACPAPRSGPWRSIASASPPASSSASRSPSSARSISRGRPTLSPARSPCSPPSATWESTRR